MKSYIPLEYVNTCETEDYSEPSAEDVDREADIRRQERALDDYCVELEKKGSI